MDLANPEGIAVPGPAAGRQGEHGPLQTETTIFFGRCVAHTGGAVAAASMPDGGSTRGCERPNAAVLFLLSRAQRLM